MRKTLLEINRKYLLNTFVVRKSRWRLVTVRGRIMWVLSSVNVSSDPFKSLYKTIWAVEIPFCWKCELKRKTLCKEEIGSLRFKSSFATHNFPQLVSFPPLPKRAPAIYNKILSNGQLKGDSAKFPKTVSPALDKITVQK